MINFITSFYLGKNTNWTRKNKENEEKIDMVLYRQTI